MVITDRHYLAYLLARTGTSRRHLATQAGWDSHTYLLRLLSGDATVVAEEPARRIAAYFGEPMDRLFAPHPSRQRGRCTPCMVRRAP